MRRWLRLASFGLAGLLGLALVVGAVFEAISRRRLQAGFPPPGRLVDVGGRQLQLDCRGAGSPLIVLEAGLGPSGSLAWGKVHDDLAKVARTCAYSRAGILWSDPREGPQTPATVADDLKALLGRAGESPPLVLVGHSLGGLYAMAYAKRFEADVAGVALVDSSHPDQLRRVEAAGLHLRKPTTMLTVASAVAWTGLPRVIFGSGDAESAFLPTTLPAMLKEWEGAEQSMATPAPPASLGGKPLFVLSAGRLSDEFLQQTQLNAEQGKEFQTIWRSLQDDEASWSTQSKHETVADAAHNLHEEKPERVIEAVRWVVDAVRAR
jgi:pimeloyl-ACP methyl ester carboxylesterase